MKHLCKDFYSPDTLSQDLEGIILEIQHYKRLAGGAPAWQSQAEEGGLSDSKSKARHVHWNKLSCLSNLLPPAPGLLSYFPFDEIMMFRELSGCHIETL